MKGGKQALGFTILETMIVLAVSGLLLISALALISGKQGTAEFQTAINDLQQQIQQVINQTESGYYPSQSDFTCTAMPGMAPVIDTNTNVSRGTNSDCLLLGNVIYFGPGNTTNSYSVYPMAAYRLTTSANPIEVTSLAEAQPTAIAQSNQAIS
jgi:type II secretory pathway pseudopilin PulG